MGNVQSITRYGLHDDNQYELIDNVSLYYIGNQVVHADDAVTDGPNYAGAFHFRDSNGYQWDTEYEYDKNGRLTRDRNKNILQIQYNLLNLPSKTTFSDGGSINYQYSASGMKQMVWGSAPGQGSKSQFYLGNYVYGNGVKQLLVDGGYVTFSGTTPQYHFYVKDHLGNNRMVVNANGTVEQVNHYYAFGALMGESTGGDVQDFKYNDKELDRLHGLDWYDYNARHMDAVRGVFTTMDPLCEGDYGISPYVYCINSPLNYTDICGLDTIPFNDVDWSSFNVNKDVIEIGNIYVFGSGSNFSSQGGGSGLNTSYNNITSSQHLGILTTYAKEIEREYEGLNTQGKSRYAYELKKFMRKQLGYNYKENLRSLYKGKIPKIINGTSKFLGRANSGITAYNLYCEISSSNQVKVSNIVNTSLLLMSTTGVGSIIAASYLFMDIGVTYYTGHGLDIYINNTSDIFFGTNKGVVYDF
jgi:RHS repeat-associated protein